jgi:FkbM family methyltransferase
MKATNYMIKAIKSGLRWLWFARQRIPLLNFPFPIRLPYGAWFLAYPDHMGISLLPRLIRNTPYEQGERVLVSRIVKPGYTCLDIGANQGFYTILFAKLVGQEGKVFAFEPTSEFQKLSLNIRVNRLHNVILERLALGNLEGETDMFVCLDGYGSRSSLRPPPDEVPARTIIERVRITTLDAYVHTKRNLINRIDFCKIDVEGAELDLLHGGSGTINEFRPVIMIEVADVTAKQWLMAWKCGVLSKDGTLPSRVYKLE